MAPDPEDLTAPRQERSRATRDRILEALARLLDVKTFDLISVAEVTAEAQCSMSSFYARFPTKDALFAAFLDRFFEVSTRQVGKALSRITAGEAGRAVRARRLIEFLLRSYRDSRGLLRSLILYDRAHPDSSFSSRTGDHKRQASSAFLALLLGEEPSAAKPRVVASASFGLWLVVQAIEKIVLFDDPILGQGRVSDRQLVKDLTFVLLKTLERQEGE